MTLAKSAVLGCLSLVAGIGGLAAWPGRETQAAQVAPRLAQVGYGELSRELRFRGTVEYVRSAEVIAPARGVLTHIGTSLGARVQEGSAIASIVADDEMSRGSSDAWLRSFYPPQREAIEAERQALLARHDSERAALQAKLTAITDLDAYPEKQSDLHVAKRQFHELDTRQRAERMAIAARLATLEQQRHDMLAEYSAKAAAAGGANVVRAPFAGVVTALSVPPGRPVELGHSILTVVDDSALGVSVSVAEETTYTLSRQKRAICSLPRRQVRTTCTLEGISRDATGYTARYRIEGVANDAFGEPGEIVVQVRGPKRGLRVPRAALLYREEGLAVRVMRDGRPVEVGVQIVFEGNLEAIVAGDLTAGEKVLIDG